MQNTYNPLKNKGRNKKIITIIIFLILIVIGFSFALGSPSINLLGRKNIKISKCELDINFKESDELMLVSKYPISTRQALEGGYKPKTVTITNNSTCDTAYYKLTIKDLINSSINKDVIQYHVVDKQNTMTYKLGDVNGNNLITSTDSLAIKQYLVDKTGKLDTIAYARYAGDVDNDGKITTNDADLIENYVVHMVNTFPAGTPLEEKTTTKEIINVNPDTFLIENSLEKGKTHEYEIIMWISNIATNTDLYVNGDTTKPIEYKYALNIEATDKKPFVPVTASEFALANVGQNGLEEVTHTIDNTLQVDSRFATEYRYRGGDSVVNNYVTFNNETWRIIGVIPTEDTDGNVENRFKIIKDKSIGNYKWNAYKDMTTNSYNNWVTGSLNTYLNNDYYNTLSSDAKSMIGTTKYYLGGYKDTNITTDVMWQYERKNANGNNCTLDNGSQTGTECYFYRTNPIMQKDINKKIALMYVSDYGYAASKECTSNLSVYAGSTSCKTTNNWLDKSQYEWALSQYSDHSYNAFLVSGSGCVSYGEVDRDYVGSYDLVARPALSLSSNIKISGGSGTNSDPYTISLK